MSKLTDRHEDIKFLFSLFHGSQTSDVLLNIDDSKKDILKLRIHDDILSDKNHIKAVSQYSDGNEKIFKIVTIKVDNKFIEVSKKDVSNIKFVIYKDDIAHELKTDLNPENAKVISAAGIEGPLYTEKEILDDINLSVGDFYVGTDAIKIDNLGIGNDRFSANIEANDNINTASDIYVIFSQTDKDQTYVVVGNRSKDNSYSFDLKDLFNKIGNTKSKFNTFILGNRGNVIHKIAYDGNPYEDNKSLFGVFDNKHTSTSNQNMYSRLWVLSDKSVVLKNDTKSNLIKEQFSLKLLATDIRKKGKTYIFDAAVYSPHIKNIDIKSAYICLRNKDRDVSEQLKIEYTKKKGKKINLRVSLDVANQKLEPNFWDMYVDVSYKGFSMGLSKVSATDKLVSRKIYHKMLGYQSYLKNKHIFTPYTTKGNELAFIYRPLDPLESRYYFFKENLAFLAVAIFGKRLRNKNIWIGFEKLAMSAHESGYYFFDYVHQNKLHDEYYYVIRKDSPEINNLKNRKEKILYYKSFKYFVYMFTAKLFISSDTRGNSYHIRVKNSRLGREVTKKPLVFLQHGYNGIKRVPDFHKARNVFDLVIAASEFEKNVIVQDWGYSPNEVVTTGFARWDHLEDKEVQAESKQIFVMPTWRTWMDGMSKEEFVKSEFYKKYMGFLSSDKLNKILTKNNVKIKFFLHPKFKSYINLFDVKSDNVATFGFLEVPLDEMIMKSSLMISDYSSIIWEMFYLGKPCVFYHFDKDKYLDYEGSYMDFDKDLFGDIAIDEDSLIKTVEEYINTDFAEKKAYHNMRSKYLTYVDNNNSARIYDAIVDNENYLYSKNKPWKFGVRKVIPFKLKLMLSKIIKGA